MQAQCHYLPTASEHLLLQALLAEDESAVIAAHAWLDTVELEAINQGVQRMVPLLYFRMRAWGMQHPLRPKVKVIYQYYWLADKRLRYQTEEVINILSGLASPLVLLKGLALGSTVYPDTACRPTTDIDLLVTPSCFKDAISRLRLSGFTSRAPAFHATTLFKSNFPEIDIHRSPYHRSFSAHFVAPLFDRLVSLRAHTFTLGAEDQLLHTIAHGTQSNVVSPLRWVVDAVLILRQATGSFRWQLFVAEALRLNLIDAAAIALQIIHTVDRHVVDTNALSTLKNLRANVRQSDRLITQENLIKQADGPLIIWRITKGNSGVFGRLCLLLTHYVQMWGELGSGHIFKRSRYYVWHYLCAIVSKIIAR